MKKWGITIIFGLSVLFGVLWISVLNKNEFVLVRPRVTDRIPAAFQDSHKVRRLEDQIVKTVHEDRIWENLEIRSHPVASIIRLPHIAVLDSTGEYNLACLVYDEVSLTFVADGQATSGEKTVFRMSAPCQFDLDHPELLGALNVPAQELSEQPIHESEIRLPSHPGYRFEITNIQGEWPTVWLLTEISYNHQRGTFQSLKAPLPHPKRALPTMVW